MKRFAYATVASCLGLMPLGVAKADSVMLTIENVRNGEGALAYTICRADEFDTAMEDSTGCDIAGRIEAQEGQTQFGVSLEAGSYAIMILHDEDRNGVMTRAGRLPGEGVGFSRNPRLIFGPPNFSRVAVDIEGHMGATIQMKYFR